MRRHLPDVEVWAYGSRVNGRSHDGSDLDLVLRGPGLEQIPIDQLVDFEEAVRESNIPFLVEARDWTRLPKRFHREIERDYVVWKISAGTDSDEGSWLYRPKFPAHWERMPLHSMAQWVNGLAFRNIQSSPIGKPVIKIAEIKGGISAQTRFTLQEFDESVRIRNGDLLFSWSGQPETSIDAFWWRGEEAWLNQHVFRVTPNAGIDNQFFYYLLRYLKPNFVAIARNKQTTGLGHVTKRDLENIVAGRPRPYEQRAIAAILGALDDRIELNRRTNETLEAMARAVFKSWFVDFEPVRARMKGRDPGMPQPIADLFPDRFVDSEIGKIPEGWEATSLGEPIELNPKRTLYKGQIAPYLDMANMPTSGHVPDEWFDKPFGSGMRFTNGDTLLARITPSLENGKTAYVDFLPSGSVGWGSTEYIVLRPRPPIPNEFAYCMVRNPGFREFAIQNMTGTSGRQRVSAKALSFFPLVIPSKEVAQTFGKLAWPLFTKASANARAARTLGTLRDALLLKLISGDIRVRDAEREAEAVV